MIDKKTLRNDLILIGSLLLVIALAIVLILVNRTTADLIAKIYVQDSLVEEIDLSKKEEKDYYIEGTKGEVHIHTHDGGIAIVESNCPHHDCVNMGYVYETNRPIICAYNAVYIIIEGASSTDVNIG